MTSDKEQIDREEIILDKDIYPREKTSKKTVDAYAEALSVGATFPPILVQKIMDESGQKTIVLDGLHRLLAYEKMEINEIDVKYWKDEVLSKKEKLKELRIAAIKANLSHGIRLSNKDKESCCQTMAREDKLMMITEEEFAGIFAVHQTTIHDWIEAIRAAQRGSRDGLIYRLWFLGWTQQEIGKKAGLKQSQVSVIIDNMDFLKINNSVKSGKSISEIAEDNALDIPVTWAMALREEDDRTRLDRFNEELIKDDESYQPIAVDVWNFPEHDARLGSKHELNVPGQIVLRYLKFFTKQDDRVLDPMAGGGSTLDACLVMGRKCRGYDKDPIEGRIDIEKRDVLDGIPKKYDHIFIDPPQSSFANILELYDFMMTVADHSYNAVKKDGTVALVISDSQEGGFVALTDKCCKIFEDTGFKRINRIICPLPAYSIDEYDDDQAIDENRFLVLNRCLTVFKKQ